MGTTILKSSRCEVCGKVFENKNPTSSLIKHQMWCKDKYEFLAKFNLNKDNLESEYVKSGSVLQFQKDHYYRESNAFYYKLFKEFNINTSIKRASNSNNVKNKRKLTNVEKYGSAHNFCKDHPSRIKWTAKLLESEGITNVFQRDLVKQKALQTMLTKYGVEHIAQHEDYKSNLQYYIKKFGEFEGAKKYADACFEKGKSMRLDYYTSLFGDSEGLIKYHKKVKKFCTGSGSVSKLSSIFSKLLDDLNIPYEQEFPLTYFTKVKVYDFKVYNTLIELNGDFWHANPNKYKEDDILKFPGGFVVAKDVWEKDKIKEKLALSNNFKIMYFWEKDLKNKKELKNIKQILNETFKN